MAINYIRATKDNLDMGRIVIQCTPDGRVFGPLMICSNRKKEIKEDSVIECYYHLNKPIEPGLKTIESKKFNLSELARVIDHHTKRKLKHEEKF